MHPGNLQRRSEVQPLPAVPGAVMIVKVTRTLADRKADQLQEGGP